MNATTDTLKNTLTAHISRTFVFLTRFVHFFNDVNVITSSCYIFSMMTKRLIVTVILSRRACMNHDALMELHGSRSCAKTLWFRTENVQASWNSPLLSILRPSMRVQMNSDKMYRVRHTMRGQRANVWTFCLVINNRRLVLIGCLSPHKGRSPHPHTQFQL